MTDDHKALLTLYGQTETGNDSLTTLLWLINAPGRLDGFLKVLAGLAAVLPIESSLESEAGAAQPDGLANEESFRPWDHWASIVENLLGRQSEVASALGNHVIAPKHQSGKSNRQTPVHGLMKSNPMYALLYFDCANPDNRDSHIELQAHALIAHAALMRRHTDISGYHASLESGLYIPSLRDYSSCIEKACRSIRQTGEQYFSDHLETVRQNSHSHSMLVGAVSRLVASLNVKRGLPYDLDLLFRRAYSDDQPKRRSGGGSHAWDRNIHIYGHVDNGQGLQLINFQVPGADERGLQLLVQGTPVEAPDRWDDGPLHPIENACDTELLLLLEECAGKPSTAASRAYSALGHARHIEMENQLLPHNWGQLTLNELSELMRHCRTEFDRLAPLTVEQDESADMKLAAICIVMIMVWTGSRLERAMKIMISESSADIEADLAYVANLKEWKIRTVIPNYQTPGSHPDETGARRRSQYIFLPDLRGVGRYLMRVRARRERPRLKLFSYHHPRHLKQALHALIDDLPKHLRISEARLSAFLFHRLMAHAGGDPVASILITGYGHHTGLIPLHYATPSAQSLRDHYANALEETVSLIHQETEKVHDASNETKKRMRASLGARDCPTNEAVRALSKGLRTRMDSIRSGEDAESVRQFHNDYTLYTALFVGFATGYRAVTDPYLGIDAIDAETGFAVISDKDGADHYKTRLVWVPEALREHLERYERHRTALLARLGIYPQFIGKNRGQLPFMFLLDSSLMPVPIRPGTVEPLLRDMYRFPLNSNRRFLRTSLMEGNCPAEVMDAFMGHWNRGTEPWGRYATLTPDDYRMILKPYLDDILASGDWYPVHGRG